MSSQPANINAAHDAPASTTVPSQNAVIEGCVAETAPLVTNSEGVMVHDQVHPLSGSTVQPIAYPTPACPFHGPVWIDFVSFILFGAAAAQFDAYLGDPIMDRGPVENFKQLVLYRDGWVKRSQPRYPARGSRDHSCYEHPSSISAADRDFIANLDPTDVQVSRIDLCLDIIGQSYPRPGGLRSMATQLGPRVRTKNMAGHFYESPQGGTTWALGGRYSDLRFQVYDKGHQLREKGYDLNAPLDHVRVELQLHGARASQVYPLCFGGNPETEIPFCFAALMHEFFRGEAAAQFFPMDSTGLTARVSPRKPSELLRSTASMVRQYGPRLLFLRQQGVLEDLLQAYDAHLRPQHPVALQRERLCRQQMQEVSPESFVGRVLNLLAPGLNLHPVPDSLSSGDPRSTSAQP